MLPFISGYAQDASGTAMPDRHLKTRAMNPASGSRAVVAYRHFRTIPIAFRAWRSRSLPVLCAL
jgi:hypothetical protein